MTPTARSAAAAAPPAERGDARPRVRRDLWGFRPDQQWVYAAFAAVLLGSMFVPRELVEEGPVICTFRRLLDLPCPGCGMTRSLVASGHGAWSAAADFHAFGVALWASLWIALVGRGLQRWRGWRVTVFPRGIWRSPAGRLFLAAWMGWALWRIVDACAA